MLAAQFTEAAAAARNSATLDNISRQLWTAHGEGHLSDPDAERISEALQARRAALAARRSPNPLKTVLGRRRPAPGSPDRQASLERRRRQAASGAMPAKLAASFTPGELAALAVIARQCQRDGACSLHIDAIAGLAGVSRSTVQRALRAARAQGLVLVRERRIPGRKSLTNVVRVIAPLWTAWLRLGPAEIGFQKRNPTGFQDSSLVEIDPARPSLRDAERLRRNFRREGTPPNGGGKRLCKGITAEA
jgi:CRP-like cAMP-binding protein